MTATLASPTPETLAATLAPSQKVASSHSRTCPCGTCRRDRDRRRKLYRVEHARGVRRMADASRCREHLAELAARGIGRGTIAAGTGIYRSTLYRIACGDTKNVKRTVEQRILAFNPGVADTVANSRIVDATATRLRYQALVALGYTQAFIAKETGRDASCLDLGARVQLRRALAVLELCRRIQDIPGPSRKAAVQARNKGWRVPADYDEDLFYDPSWDGTEPDCASGSSTALHYLAEYDFLSSDGMLAEQIAEKLGVTSNYLQILLRRRERGEGPWATLASTERRAG